MTEQPETFAFNDENMALARKHIDKYPSGRQASAASRSSSWPTWPGAVTRITRSRTP